MKVEGKGDHNEHLVIFRNSTANSQQTLVRDKEERISVKVLVDFIRKWFYASIHTMNRIVYYYIHHFGFSIVQNCLWNFK